MLRVDKELLLEATQAQLQHAAGLATSDHWTYSDDGLDYLKSSFSLASALLEFYEDDNVEGFREMLEEEGSIMDTYACDGVSPWFYDGDRVEWPCMGQED